NDACKGTTCPDRQPTNLPAVSAFRFPLSAFPPRFMERRDLRIPDAHLDMNRTAPVSAGPGAAGGTVRRPGYSSGAGALQPLRLVFDTAAVRSRVSASRFSLPVSCCAVLL